MQEYGIRRKLRIILLIGESESQWHASSILHSHHDWDGPFLGRYWVACDLQGLLADNSKVRVYQAIKEQWQKLWAGREQRSDGIRTEGRPTMGRSGPRLVRRH